MPQNSNKWTYTAGALIVFALFLTKGGLASLVPLLRFCMPVVLIFLVYRIIKVKLKSAVSDALRQGQAPRRAAEPPGGNGPVIDLCPKCGAYLKAGHRC